MPKLSKTKGQETQTPSDDRNGENGESVIEWKVNILVQLLIETLGMC